MSIFKRELFEKANIQAAEVLLKSSIIFLLRNGFSSQKIRKCVDGHLNDSVVHKQNCEFDYLTHAYEEMGTVLSTWFDCPYFLDEKGDPAPISIRRGPTNLAHLLKSAKVGISSKDAIALFRISPSVCFNANNTITALRRVFVLGGIDSCRAALVIPRYLDTLSSNSNAYKTGTVKLLERQCSVSKIDLRSIAPILRRIKEQGGSFVDSIDGQIERRKTKLRSRKANSELGLLVFAWTKTTKRK